MLSEEEGGAMGALWEDAIGAVYIGCEWNTANPLNLLYSIQKVRTHDGRTVFYCMDRNSTTNQRRCDYGRWPEASDGQQYR